jgi:5-formyltetrahydrofolate cyclo-ligase
MAREETATPEDEVGTTADAPLYEQVRDRLSQMILARSLSDSTPMPTEPILMELFGVSRGTLRRAIEELVRDGLLSAEQGRGTFVVQEERVRRVVWRRLSEVALPDSRFDMDLSHFVPDFAGSVAAQERVMKHPQWMSANIVFCAPDNSLELLRLSALTAGKKILVPTYGLRRGFIFIDGVKIQESDHALAATLDGLERFGKRLGPADLRQAGIIDLVITGATAVTTHGLHIGGGQRYLALEWMMMKQLGVLAAGVKVFAVVHDCQVVEEMVDAEPDCLLDLICTNSQEIDVSQPRGSRQAKFRRIK